MHLLGVCDQLIFFKPSINRWVCGATFNDIAEGISTDPANFGITEKIEPPLCGWEPNWIDVDRCWGTCATDLFFAPKFALECTVDTRATPQSRGQHNIYG